LRARQGAGARYDAEGAPARELAWARRGTAYFARLLNNLMDFQLYEPSSIQGRSRAQVVAAVALNPRELALIIEAARVGMKQYQILASDEREVEIAFAATLPAHALRSLFKLSEVHLNVEWRDLKDSDWLAVLKVGPNASVSLLNSPLVRARFIWKSSIDLNSNGSLKDLPDEFRTKLL
jgi:maleylpyruvate isomerase